MFGRHRYAHESADDNFLLLHADWTVQQARQRPQRARDAGVSAAIIQRDQPTRTFFLRPLKYVSEQLDPHHDQANPLNAALTLDQWESAAVVDAFATGYVDGPAVIVDDGHPVAFVLPTAGVLAFTPLESTEMAMLSEAAAPRAANGDGTAAPPEPRSLNAEMDAIVPPYQETVLTVILSAPAVSEVGSLPVAAAAGSDIELLVRPLDNVFAVVDNANLLRQFGAMVADKFVDTVFGEENDGVVRLWTPIRLAPMPTASRSRPCACVSGRCSQRSTTSTISASRPSTSRSRRG